MLSRRKKTRDGAQQKTRDGAQQKTRDGAHAVPAGRSRGGAAGRVGWTIFGFVMGIGVWHAVGFWSFVTAVTLTGKPPERASITSAVLMPEASEQRERIEPPKPVPAARRQQRAETPAPGSPSGQVTLPQQPLPQVTTAVPAEAQPRPAGGTIVFAQPRINPSARGSEPAPAPNVPATTVTAERAAPPQPAPAPSGGSNWSTRIITGTVD